MSDLSPSYRQSALQCILGASMYRSIFESSAGKAGQEYKYILK